MSENTLNLANNNYILPTIFINDVSLLEGNTLQSNANFTVSLSQTFDTPITVNYNTVDNSAIAGSDYKATQGLLTFEPGETIKTISIELLGDNDAEKDERFYLTLTNPNNAKIGDKTGVGLITNDDFIIPDISVTDVTIVEGNNFQWNINFKVSLSERSNLPINVAYNTSEGTATEGSDYVGNQGTLTFRPGEAFKNVSVTVIGDNEFEANENFFLNLKNANNAVITKATGTGTITDNDLTIPRISISDATVTEGNSGEQNADFTIFLSESPDIPLTVNYATADYRAEAGSDYLTTQGTLTLEPGETIKTISVPVLGDTEIENNEQFFVNLSNPSNGLIRDGRGVSTINDGNDILFNNPIYRFQNTDKIGTYLYATQQERINIRRNFSHFQEEGIAFNASIQPGDDLISLYRFENTAQLATYLYVGENERQNIIQNFPNFVEQGLAFYTYGADANVGRDIYRFQNLDKLGTYLYVGEAEKNNILANSNFSNFRLEGVAFEVV